MALYNFLEEIHLTEHLQEIVDELMDTDRDQLAMEYSQVSSSAQYGHGADVRLHRAP